MTRQCLSRRIENIELLRAELQAWESERNNSYAKVNWQFTASDVRVKCLLSTLTLKIDDLYKYHHVNALEQSKGRADRLPSIPFHHSKKACENNTNAGLTIHWFTDANHLESNCKSGVGRSWIIYRYAILIIYALHLLSYNEMQFA